MGCKVNPEKLDSRLGLRGVAVPCPRCRLVSLEWRPFLIHLHGFDGQAAKIRREHSTVELTFVATVMGVASCSRFLDFGTGRRRFAIDRRFLGPRAQPWYNSVGWASKDVSPEGGSDDERRPAGTDPQAVRRTAAW